MDVQQTIDLSRQALMTALVLGTPVLAAGLIVALLVGLFQALTQIQDQTIGFITKLVAMVVALGACLPWLVERMVVYSQDLISNIPQTIVGG
jgi:flagellar biosynthetic protein FliQ